MQRSSPYMYLRYKPPFRINAYRNTDHKLIVIGDHCHVVQLGFEWPKCDAEIF